MTDPFDAARRAFVVAYRGLLCSVHAEMVYSRRGREQGVTALMSAMNHFPSFHIEADQIVPSKVPTVGEMLKVIAERARALDAAHTEEMGEAIVWMSATRATEFDFGRAHRDYLGPMLDPDHPNPRGRYRRTHDAMVPISGLAQELWGRAQAAVSLAEKGEPYDAELATTLTVAGALALLLLAPAARTGDRQLRAARENPAGPRADTRAVHNEWVALAREMSAEDPARTARAIAKDITNKAQIVRDGPSASVRTVEDVLNRRCLEWKYPVAEPQP